jgi:hypothetical protein
LPCWNDKKRKKKKKRKGFSIYFSMHKSINRVFWPPQLKYVATYKQKYTNMQHDLYVCFTISNSCELLWSLTWSASKWKNVFKLPIFTFPTNWKYITLNSFSVLGLVVLILEFTNIHGINVQNECIRLCNKISLYWKWVLNLVRIYRIFKFYQSIDRVDIRINLKSALC